MRELGMWDVSEGLGQSFADIEAYLGNCRFRDCTHGNEPGCAIKTAIRNGELSPERWESYLQLGTEARYTDDKIGYLKDKEKWYKDIALKVRAWQKSGYQHPIA
jgi:ribosome biogenesis GTPase